MPISGAGPTGDDGDDEGDYERIDIAPPSPAMKQPTLYFFVDKEFVEARRSDWQKASSCFRISASIQA